MDLLLLVFEMRKDDERTEETVGGRERTRGEKEVRVRERLQEGGTMSGETDREATRDPRDPKGGHECHPSSPLALSLSLASQPSCPSLSGCITPSLSSLRQGVCLDQSRLHLFSGAEGSVCVSCDDAGARLAHPSLSGGGGRRSGGGGVGGTSRPQGRE